jgi:hypothetical protein
MSRWTCHAIFPYVSSAAPAIALFWANYLSLLKKRHIPAKALKWYGLHLEQYIQAHPQKPLATHSPVDVTTWLDVIGRQADCADWQFAHIADALQIISTS